MSRNFFSLPYVVRVLRCSKIGQVGGSEFLQWNIIWHRNWPLIYRPMRGYGLYELCQACETGNLAMESNYPSQTENWRCNPGVGNFIAGPFNLADYIWDDCNRFGQSSEWRCPCLYCHRYQACSKLINQTELWINYKYFHSLTTMLCAYI